MNPKIYARTTLHMIYTQIRSARVSLMKPIIFIHDLLDDNGYFLSHYDKIMFEVYPVNDFMQKRFHFEVEPFGFCSSGPETPSPILLLSDYFEILVLYT